VVCLFLLLYMGITNTTLRGFWLVIAWVVWLAIAALALVLFAVTFPLYIRLLKYDAAKTMAAFGATLRSEVDLDTLRDHLLSVVQETIQPAHVSLWLRQPERDVKRDEYSCTVRRLGPAVKHNIDNDHCGIEEYE